MAGTWAPLTNQPPFNASTMLLLTDGTVLCQDSFASDWWKLTPDQTGSSVNGTWSALANGPNSPLYYASAILRDGRVFVAGGEDNAGQLGVELLAAQIYDPVTDTWATIATPAGWANIGDAPSCVLPDGRVLLGSIFDTRTAIYDPVTNTWAAGPDKGDASAEETWTLLPDETVLVIQCSNHPNTEKFVIAANTWVTAGSTPSDLVEAASIETGPCLLLPDGRVFAVGATGHTALYTIPPISSQPGSWTAGPDFPMVGGQTVGAKDGPACLLPNGRVLCAVGPVDGVKGDYLPPTYFFEFDPANSSLTAVTNPPTSGRIPYEGRMLLLPSGQVLFSTGSNNVQVYTPDGAPDPAWKPSITSGPTSLRSNHTYKLSGRQLNGLSQAVSYGDDAQMATNYPLVCVTNLGTNDVFYCRTHDHSTMGVNTGTVVHSTLFDVPAGIENGASELCVIANGIRSDPLAVTVGKVIKEHKDFKEHKDHKDKDKDFKEKDKDLKEKEIKEKEIKDKDKDQDFMAKVSSPEKLPELKVVAEGGLGQGLGIQPEWLRSVIQQLSDRMDRIESQLATQRPFITAEERPRVGEEALRGLKPGEGKQPPIGRGGGKQPRVTGPSKPPRS